MKNYVSLVILVLIFVVIVFGGCLPIRDTEKDAQAEIEQVGVNTSRSDVKDYMSVINGIEAEIGDIEWKSGEIAKIDDELLNENGDFYLARLEERYFVISVDKGDILKVDVLLDITENGTYYLDEINGITYNAIRKDNVAYILKFQANNTSVVSFEKIIQIEY